MFRTALRNVLAHKGRLLMTMLAVMLGTAFVAGTMVFTDSVRQSIMSGTSRSFTGISVQVTDESARKRGTPGEEPDALLTDETLTAIRARPDAESVRGSVSGPAEISDGHGNLVGRPGKTYGANWFPGSDGQDQLYPMTQGRGPAGPTEVAIDRKSADSRGVKIGDSVWAAVDGPVIQATVAGIFNTDDPQVASGGTKLLFDTITAQRLYLRPGRFSAVSAQAAPGVSDYQLATEIEGMLWKAGNLKVETAAELRSRQMRLMEKGTSQLRAILLGFTGIALLVGVFLISNTFTMLIAQRTRELALLRAVGASRQQVRRLVLVEALLTGGIGSMFGLLVGVGIGLLMQSVMSSVDPAMAGRTVISPTSVLATLATGTLVTVVSALLPARRASAAAPVAAMSANDSPVTQRSLIVRNSIGAVLITIGLLTMVSQAKATGGASS
ncbi:ABC transporter permease [Kitasatospora sp. NPDC089509]|uniref:ABC transporter permease n=1 Tax=Kitasatospora sp. NPDC089509 TaxID=3364079 RepID=UPI0037F8F4B1